MGVPWEVHQGLLTAFSFVVGLLTAVPLYWHLEAWNVGCVLYIFWISLSCLIQFVNGVIWRDNAILFPGTTVWCDIVTRFNWAVPHGVLAASLVINRRLFKIATTTSVSIMRSDKRRMIWIDLAIGLFPPLAHLITMWFMQGHRFNIWEGVGCVVAIPNTYLALAFTGVVSLLLGLVSAVYCVGTIMAFMKRRRQFSELLSSNSNLTTNRYLRLIALAGIEILCTLPLTIWLITFQLSQPIYEWKGLADMHSGFSRIEQYPAMQWLTWPFQPTGIVATPWLVITCGITFFGFFGLAEEARSHYRMALTTVAKKLGYTQAPTSSSGFSSGLPPSKGSKFGVSITIPSFVQRSMHRRGSVSSFSDKLSTSISVGDIDLDEKEKPYTPASSHAGSSTCVSSPADGSVPKLDIPRPDSGVVDMDELVRHMPEQPKHAPGPDMV